jgi:hypothetical protein
MIQGFGGGFWGVAAGGGALASGRYKGPFWPQLANNTASHSPINATPGRNVRIQKLLGSGTWKQGASITRIR